MLLSSHKLNNLILNHDSLVIKQHLGIYLGYKLEIIYNCLPNISICLKNKSSVFIIQYNSFQNLGYLAASWFHCNLTFCSKVKLASLWHPECRLRDIGSVSDETQHSFERNVRFK